MVRALPNRVVAMQFPHAGWPKALIPNHNVRQRRSHRIQHIRAIRANEHNGILQFRLHRRNRSTNIPKRFLFVNPVLLMVAHIAAIAVPHMKTNNPLALEMGLLKVIHRTPNVLARLDTRQERLVVPLYRTDFRKALLEQHRRLGSVSFAREGIQLNPLCPVKHTFNALAHEVKPQQPAHVRQREHQLLRPHSAPQTTMYRLR